MPDPASSAVNDGNGAAQRIATRGRDALLQLFGLFSASLKRAWDPAADPIVAGGITPRVTGSFSRAAGAAGAYATGDLVGQAEAAAGVSAIEFTAARKFSGEITGARLVMTTDGAAVVPTGLELILFRAAPFAAGAYPADNGPCVGAAGVLGAAAAKNIIGRIRFSDFLQCAAGVVYSSGPVISRNVAPFNLAELNSQKIFGLLVLPSGAAWNPGAAVYGFDLALDVHQD